MDWSERCLLFGGKGVGDNMLGARGRFCGADLNFGSVARWVAALDDLLFSALRNLYRGPRLAPVSSKGSLAPILVVFRWRGKRSDKGEDGGDGRFQSVLLLPLLML